MVGFIDFCVGKLIKALYALEHLTDILPNCTGPGGFNLPKNIFFDGVSLEDAILG